MKHKRRVRFEIVLPATVELLVGTDDDAPSEDSDWSVIAVGPARCEATPQIVEERMHGSDAAALAALAASAEDVCG